jgi:hypothetical protein
VHFKPYDDLIRLKVIVNNIGLEQMTNFNYKHSDVLDAVINIMLINYVHLNYVNGYELIITNNTGP